MKKLILAFICFFTFGNSFAQDVDFQRIQEVYNHISNLYVDSVPNQEVSEAAIVAMLEVLDPHSTYITAKEVSRANERIDGSFEGVGIQFNILKDTLIVVTPITGGPSEKVGVMAGDKIIEIDGENVAGVGLQNSDVRDKLLGKKGTKVTIKVIRGKSSIMDFTITRDKIPVNSVVSYYMVDKKIGYIKLISFSRTTKNEVQDAIKDLKSQGMEDLIFDLTGNGGGLLNAAQMVADEFLNDDKLIVYSEGRAQPRSDLNSTKRGNFETGRLVILIDENSASASEIVSGAVQDWDRGLLVGRRTFGKGLVQRPINLSDGAQIRLTIARYYTPSGRWIQKPYDDLEEYRNDYMNRYLHGEMMHLDSIEFADSLIYHTLINKRVVYGGGGIMPDVFIPLDTSEYSQFYKDLSRSGVINTFCLEYVNKNRISLNERFKNVDDLIAGFETDKAFMDEFFKYAVAEDSSLVFVEEDYKISGDLLRVRLKAVVAQDMFGISAFYKIFNQKNEIFLGGVEALKGKRYKKEKLVK